MRQIVRGLVRKYAPVEVPALDDRYGHGWWSSRERLNTLLREEWGAARWINSHVQDKYGVTVWGDPVRYEVRAAPHLGLAGTYVARVHNHDRPTYERENGAASFMIIGMRGMGLIWRAGGLGPALTRRG